MKPHLFISPSDAEALYAKPKRFKRAHCHEAGEFVTCVYTRDGDGLTLYKSYRVVKVNKDHVTVVNDRNDRRAYGYKRFK